MRTVPKPWVLLLLALSASILSALSLKAVPMPFVWAGLAWAGALVGAIFCVRGTGLRAVLFNAAVAAAVVSATEAYVSLHEIDPPSYSDGYRVQDDVLGFAPVKGVHGHATRISHGGTLYDVGYTIDSNGLRVAPPVKAGARTILFFGCSFTFGEGLRDQETLPYQVGLQSDGRYRTFNFGFHGYGPHQMLAEIEQGLVGRIVDGEPEYAIYQAVPHHVARVAGKVSFGKHAPRYELNPDGTVRLAGHFEEQKKTYSPLEEELRWQLGKSGIYRMLANREPAVSEADVALTLAIVRKSRDLLVARYPGIRFHVILWQSWKEERKIYEELRDGFRRMNVPVHLVSDILPHYTLGPSPYVLSAYDRHPSALADRMLARYVFTNIVAAEPTNPVRGDTHIAVRYVGH